LKRELPIPAEQAVSKAARDFNDESVLRATGKCSQCSTSLQC